MCNFKPGNFTGWGSEGVNIIIIIMYTYHALIKALSAHRIHINPNMILYTHVEHSPTKTIYIKYYIYIYNGAVWRGREGRTQAAESAKGRPQHGRMAAIRFYLLSRRLSVASAGLACRSLYRGTSRASPRSCKHDCSFTRRVHHLVSLQPGRHANLCRVPHEFLPEAYNIARKIYEFQPPPPPPPHTHTHTHTPDFLLDFEGNLVGYRYVRCMV